MPSEGFSNFDHIRRMRAVHCVLMFRIFPFDAIRCCMSDLIICAVLSASSSRLLGTIISWCDSNTIAGRVLAPTRVIGNVFIIDTHYVTLNRSSIYV